MSFDCVVSYHHNVHTCGVARFNKSLAMELGVPMVQISSSLGRQFTHPIVSVKSEEMSPSSFSTLLNSLPARYVLVLHGYSGTKMEDELVRNATQVMTLNAQMAAQLANLRNDIVIGFAPGTRPSANKRQNELMRLITFGMAHKIQATGYRIVGELLKTDSRDYVLEISSALHEGTSFDDEFFSVGSEISGCFGGKVDFLGFLADSEVSRRMIQADAMLAFFPEGARENNTSIASAMSHGLPVITNLDSWSPRWMIHGETVFDVNQLEEFPVSDQLRAVGTAGKEVVDLLDYSALIDLLASN